MQCEQHVRVAPVFLICARFAGAACGDGCVQEEGGFLSCRRPKLTLILKLQEGERDTESRVRVNEGDHRGL